MPKAAILSPTGPRELKETTTGENTLRSSRSISLNSISSAPPIDSPVITKTIFTDLRWLVVQLEGWTIRNACAER
jgi:hypothetical protein